MAFNKVNGTTSIAGRPDIRATYRNDAAQHAEKALKDIFALIGGALACSKCSPNDTQEAIKLYTSDSIFKPLNAALREKQPLLPEWNDYVRLLCHALWKSVQNDLPDTVWRGVQLTSTSLQTYKIGAVLTWHGFTSTSKNQDVACRFATGSLKFAHVPVLFDIVLPKGRRNGVASIATDSNYTAEEEILISCGSSFEVLGVQNVSFKVGQGGSIQGVKIYLELISNTEVGYYTCEKCQKIEAFRSNVFNPSLLPSGPALGPPQAGSYVKQVLLPPKQSGTAPGPPPTGSYAKQAPKQSIPALGHPQTGSYAKQAPLPHKQSFTAVGHPQTHSNAKQAPPPAYKKASAPKTGAPVPVKPPFY